MRRVLIWAFALILIMAFAMPALSQATGVQVPSLAEFSDLVDRVTSLEQRVDDLESASSDDGSTDDGSTDDGSTDDGSTDDGTVDDGSDDGSTDDGSTDDGSTDDGTADDGVDQTVTGDTSGFTVLAGETWEIEGDVTSNANVIVEGTLKMRAGSSLTFVDVDESAFVGGGMDPVDSDVGLWVINSGVLDIQGTEKQGWNRTGTHETWNADDEYVRTPSGDEEGPQSFELGDEVPCVTFAGEEYCAEVINLTRDVVIQGTEGGESHIFIRSDQPQMIKHAEMRFLGPNGDTDAPDGRYGIHFHHAGDGARGSLVEGVVVRDTGDHAFAPHESNGITFRDTVAYKVTNSPYWWDPGDAANDITYDRALALDVTGDRDNAAARTAFTMAKGEGNVVKDSVASHVRGGRSTSGYGWNAGGHYWTFENNVAHHNSGNGVYHWGNEPFVDTHHVQTGFVGYANGDFGIEQGAYRIKSHWYDTTLFNNGTDSVRQRGVPAERESFEGTEGILYQGGVFDERLAIMKTRLCTDHLEIVFEDIELGTVPIYVDQGSCNEGEQFLVRFTNVLTDGRDLTREDFEIANLPASGKITVERTDGETFTITG